MDITQLILDDHREQRRLFAVLEQIDRTDSASLRAVWGRLATFLEVHAEAEEEVFYPELLRLGRGAGGADPEAETEDAMLVWRTLATTNDTTAASVVFPNRIPGVRPRRTSPAKRRQMSPCAAFQCANLRCATSMAEDRSLVSSCPRCRMPATKRCGVVIVSAAGAGAARAGTARNHSSRRDRTARIDASAATSRRSPGTRCNRAHSEAWSARSPGMEAVMTSPLGDVYRPLGADAPDAGAAHAARGNAAGGIPAIP
jgi:hypothetical protein